MNKKVIVAGLSVVALGAAHTAFWVYQSGKIKSSIEQMAGKISKEIGRKNAEFFYTSSEVSGYPLNFTVNVSQPKFISSGGGEKLELSSGDEHLVVTSNLLGSSYKISLPNKLDIKYSAAEKEKNYKLEFTKASPEVNLEFSRNILFSSGAVADIAQFLDENLQSLNYADSGYVLSSAEDGAKLASSDSDYVRMTKSRSKPDTITTSYSVKTQNMDHSALFVQEESASEPVAGFWPISTNLNLSSVDERDESGKSKNVNLIVTNADITAATFELGLSGDVKANGEDIFPFGDLSLRVKNYQNMVDYFSGMASSAFAESKIPLFHIKTEKSIDFKKVLYEVASEKSNDDKDLLLTLSREKGKSLFIGQKGLMEVIDLLKASASATKEEPAKDASAPRPPLLDAAPSAGLPTLLPKAK